jgi:mono/diheme cytochrome c family protein
MLRLPISLFLAAAAVFAQDAATVQTALKQYCQGCHNDQSRVADFSLDGVATADVANHAGKLEKVLRKLKTGEMPPKGLPRPKPEANAALASWLETRLDENIRKFPNPGTPTVHRLNRAEYANAVRDLLDLDLDHAASLPADDSGYGFDNIGSVLTVSPLLMEKYMTTARRVVRQALGTAKQSPVVEKYTFTRPGASDSGEALPLSLRSGMTIKHYFPVDAEYVVTVRVRGNPDPTLPPAKLDVRVDGVRAKLIDTVYSNAEESQATRNSEVRVPLKAGLHTIGAGFLTELAKSETTAGATVGRFGPPPASLTQLEYVLIGGPFNPTGPGDTPSRRRILQCAEKTAACANKIMATLARQAYRRPVTAADLAPLQRLYTSAGSFDAGLEMALRGILVSPNFLFRKEANGATPLHKVSDLELASRLSFFLWSSIPDEELLRLGEQKRLRPVLAAQVKRMLADPKAKALVDNFAGQWLHLRNVPSWRPDPEKYPQFDDSLRTALQKETEAFFTYIVKEDRRITDFLNADYTFLNERLARHYGIPGVRGTYFRKVALTNPERGGLLSHGSILTVTSYPTRTSPVLRGKWILENIVGAPPPPPPPDVPDLADSANGSAKDLRAALQAHRAKAACASCHDRLDPLGFALENYDATGKFRAEEGGVKIDASGALPGGVMLDGPGDLKRILSERQDEFVDCLAEKLLTYALGRGLEHYDMPAIRQIRRDAAKNEHQFSALVNAIVNSVPFQMRRSPER